MENSLISVIVPVYKVEKYLEQCVNSIISQTYSNLEIILVDDGSPDKCPQICDDFAMKDSRISVIHKENGGPAEARNIGTKKSSGEYIAFVDSDDWIHPKYIENLYNNLKENNAEISICNNIDVIDNRSSDKIEKNGKISIFSNIEAVETLFYQRIYDTAPHCKLYLSSIPKSHPYPKGRLYEDLFETYKMLLDTNKVVYCDNVLYYYRDNPNSIMHKKFTLKMFDELDAADEIEAFVKENCPELLPAAYSRKFSSYSQVLRWTKDAPDTPEIQEKRDYIWKFLKQYQWKMFTDKKARAKNRLAAFLMIFGQKNFMKF